MRYQQVVKNHDKTFGWLFERNKVQFMDWLEDPKQTGPAGRLFWITGKPGSGKSTIMKHAIRNPKTMDCLSTSSEREWQIIPFFFSDRGSEKQRALQTMLQEILYQLLDLIVDSFKLVRPLYTSLTKTQKTKTPKWSLGTLRQGISDVIAKSSSEAGICLFVDALDEHSGDNENLCKFFWELSNEPEGSIFLKICLASRPWPVFKRNFNACRSFSIHEHTENDIWNYVTSRLYESSGSAEPRHMATEDEIQEDIGMTELAKDVTQRAQGVFIWVRLVIDELFQGLIDGTPITMLKDVLKNIPNELKDLYERALRKVKTEYAAEAHILLHMVLSSLSPLQIRTLLGCATWLQVGKADSQKSEAQVSRLASRTGGLLEIIYSDDSSVVQFIHQTAREYVRSHKGRLGLSHLDPAMLDPSSPLVPIRKDEIQDMEGSEFLLICGAKMHTVHPSTFTAEIAPYLFTYAKEVDNRFPFLGDNRMNVALDTLSSLLDDKSRWQDSPVYPSLESFTAGPSRADLAVSANWTNLITKFFNSTEDISKTLHLAALGPSILDDCTERLGMVKALIDDRRLPSPTSHDPFKLREQEAWPMSPGLRFAPPERMRFGMIEEQERRRMFESIGVVAHDVRGGTTLLATLVSIKSHPFVSESERVKLGALLLEPGVGPVLLEDNGTSLRLDIGVVYFRSELSLCLHIGSAEWVNMVLVKARRRTTFSEECWPFAHCVASTWNFANPALRASFLRESFGINERELYPIPDDNEESLVGVGWALTLFGSQCGIVGFPHINRGFCSSDDHPPELTENVQYLPIGELLLAGTIAEAGI